MLQEALMAYFGKDAQRYWMFVPSKSGHVMPYLITRIEYCSSRGQDDPAVTTIQAVSLSKGEKASYSNSWHGEDLGRTLSELLEAANIYHEDDDLLAAYDKANAVYVKYAPMHNEQFLGIGSGQLVSTDDDDRYSRRFGSYAPLGLEGVPVKLVNDEAVSKKESKGTKVRNAMWRRDKMVNEEDAMLTIPTHPYIFMFNLELHRNFWVHVDQLKPYQYDASLRHKLILPPEHSDIIDVLTEDIGEIMGDIIEGKSGGTIILAKGGPGTGKTLTAEAYSEIARRPLYKVQSDQLGVEPGQIEKRLKACLERASRWGAALLVDECDVYVRSRGDDIQQNSIVGTFLRTLEYYNGLLFLTTNRGTMVDDAIVSRCTAIITYENPTEESARLIWEVQAEQGSIVLEESLIDELVTVFPDISGRSIRNLLKLTYRYCKKHARPLAVSEFKHLSKYLEL